jgi:nicotinamidase-related amidase
MEPLMIVDLQCAFVVPPEFLRRLKAYAARFPRRIFTRFENPSGSLFRKLLQQDSCAPGTPDTTLRIPPKPGDVVFTKRGYGLSPNHIRRLRRMKVKRVTVCGIDTDACVLGVMYSLFDAGIDCRVNPGMCHSTSGKALHNAGLRIIEQQFPPPKRNDKGGGRARC